MHVWVGVGGRQTGRQTWRHTRARTQVRTHAPLCLSDLSVVAKTTAALASCALVIQALLPFSTYSSPVGSGVKMLASVREAVCLPSSHM